MTLIKQDAEANLLGGLIVSGRDVILSFSEKLKGEMFGYEPNRTIWLKLKEMAQSNMAIDIITLKESLTDDALKAVGGVQYLSALIGGVPDDPKVGSYFTIVSEFYARRQFRDKGLGLANKAETASTLSEVIEAAHNLKVDMPITNAPTISSASEDAMNRIAQERKAGFDLKWGIKDLDALMGGLPKKKMSVVGAKTSHGKTTMFCNVALNNLESNENIKLLYSGSENIEDIPVKIASMRSGVPLDWFVKPHLITDAQLDQCMAALLDMGRFKDRLMILSGAGPAAIRQVAASYKPDLICLDYIQRYAITSGGDKDSVRHAVNKTAAEMQQISLDYNAHVMLMSQIKRLNEERKKGAPDINDLKESGDLENFADYIVIGWWPWRDTMQDSKYMQTEYHMIVGKNKLGPCMPTKAYFNLKTMRLA